MRKVLITCLGLVLGLQWCQPIQASSPLTIAGSLSGVSVSSALSAQQVRINDPLYSSQDYLQTIGFPTAWNTTAGSSSSPIAIIDTGIDLRHEDLKDRLWVNRDEVPSNSIDDDNNGYVDDYNGYNFLKRSKDISDPHGHGTGIASVIAAATNNDRGMAGINWFAPIMMLRALDSTGDGDFETVSEALRYAVDNGAKVINMSFGAAEGDDKLLSAVNYAISHNVIIVAAVGNNHGSGVFYPAVYPSVIAVSSLTDNNKLSSFSNYGTGTDVAAPGEDIVMATPSSGKTSKYIFGSGSSFSSAEVAGIVSLLAAKYPNLTPASADSMLKNTATKLSGDSSGQYFGSGRVNAAVALTQTVASLNANVTLSAASAFANGLSPITVSAKITDDLGQPQINTAITATVSGSANIVNGALVAEGSAVQLGVTNSQGMVSFTVASTYPETKWVSLSAGASNVRYISDSSGLVFRPTPNARYTMQWLQQSPTVSFAVGKPTTLWVEVKNTGNVAWVSDSTSSTHRGSLRLGTANPLDRTSILYDAKSWPSQNRSSNMTPSVVRPGETARFTFSATATQLGNFREYFRPVIEYVGWLNDLGIYWDVTVTDTRTINPE